MKYTAIILAILFILTGCMNPTISDNVWGWNVESDNTWTLRIDARYADGWKTHLISKQGDDEFDIGPIIGTDQQRWTASFSTEVHVRVVYDGDEIYNGELQPGETIQYGY